MPLGPGAGSSTKGSPRAALTYPARLGMASLWGVASWVKLVAGSPGEKAVQVGVVMPARRVLGDGKDDGRGAPVYLPGVAAGVAEGSHIPCCSTSA